jgi:hypothetical protein
MVCGVQLLIFVCPDTWFLHPLDSDASVIRCAMSFFLFHYPALCFGFMYLEEEVNSSYRQICKDINTDIHSKDTLLEKIKLEFKELQQQTSPGMQFSALIFYFSYC